MRARDRESPLVARTLVWTSTVAICPQMIMLYVDARTDDPWREGYQVWVPEAIRAGPPTATQAKTYCD